MDFEITFKATSLPYGQGDFLKWSVNGTEDNVDDMEEYIQDIVHKVICKKRETIVKKTQI